MKNLMNEGHTKNAALKYLNKNLKTFQRIRQIYELKHTRPLFYRKVCAHKYAFTLLNHIGLYSKQESVAILRIMKLCSKLPINFSLTSWNFLENQYLFIVRKHTSSGVDCHPSMYNHFVFQICCACTELFAFSVYCVRTWKLKYACTNYQSVLYRVI